MGRAVRPCPNSYSCHSSMPVDHVCTSPAPLSSREGNHVERHRNSQEPEGLGSLPETGVPRLLQERRTQVTSQSPECVNYKYLMVSELWVHLGAFAAQELAVSSDLWVTNDGQSTIIPTCSGAETGPLFAASPEGASSPESSATGPACTSAQTYSHSSAWTLGSDFRQALSV